MTNTQVAEPLERETLQEFIERTVINKSKTSEQFRKRVRHYQNYKYVLAYNQPGLRTGDYMGSATNRPAFPTERGPLAYYMTYGREILERIDGECLGDGVYDKVREALEFKANFKRLLLYFRGLNRSKLEEAEKKMMERTMTEKEYKRIEKIFFIGKK